MEEEIVIDYELFDEINEDGPCIIFNDEKSELLGKKCYSIKDFSQIRPSMEVHMAFYEGGVFDKDCFYYCLPCLHKPLNGVVYEDGRIVSVRWKIDGRLVYKGFYGKAFVVPMMDMFVDGQCLCLRLYENKMHITGKMTYGVETVNKACVLAQEILEKTYAFWSACREQPQLFLETTQWLAQNSMTKDTCVVITDANNEERIDYTINWPSFAPEKYHYFATEIIERYADIRYVSELLPRSKKILAGQQPASEECYITQAYCSLVRCIYHLGFSPNLSALVRFLTEHGYQITNHDVGGSNVNLQYIDHNVYPDDCMISRKDGKLHSQSFTFSTKGTIQHAGTGYTRHEEAYKTLMRDIILFEE